MGTSETHEVQIGTAGAAAPRLAGCGGFIGCAIASVAGTLPPPPPPPPTAPLDPELFHSAMREEAVVVASSAIDDNGLDMERYAPMTHVSGRRAWHGGCFAREP